MPKPAALALSPRPAVARRATALGTITALSVALAACGTSPHGAAPASTSSGRLAAQALTPCQAVYATRPAAPVVEPDIRYGSPGTLILSFVDNATKARAVDYITARAVDYTTARAVDYTTAHPGLTVGALLEVPAVAVRAPVLSARLVNDLVADFGSRGLLSVYQDEPLKFFLAESVALIGADRARSNFGLTGKGVGVAVVDSGVDATHRDLSGAVARNVKLVGLLSGSAAVTAPNTDLTSGHGTHVASTVAGSGAASGGKYKGVAPGARLVGVGVGEAITVLFGLEGLDYALRPDVRAAHNVRVISNSWGTKAGPFEPYHPINLASKRAYDAGVTVVFAAGNDGPGPNTMSAYAASPCVISVAAGDKSRKLADYSGRGVANDPLQHPDITAPGSKIVAARAVTGALTPPFTGDPLNGAWYASLSGTSMAAPHVSGVVALMLEANPRWRMDDVLGALRRSAIKVPGRAEWEVGAGYLNAYEATRLARQR